MFSFLRYLNTELGQLGKLNFITSLSFFFFFCLKRWEGKKKKIKGRRLEKFNRGRKSLLKKKKTRADPSPGMELKY